MIKLNDGELLDLLPAAMKAGVDMVCLSYAIKQVTKELLQTLEYTRTQSFIDGLTYGAVRGRELITPSYSILGFF